jgi:hypothetical protein
VKEQVIVAIHGILTGETSRTWPSRLKVWIWENRGGEFTVINREYKAGFLPPFNVFIRNKYFLAPALAEFIKPYAERGADISFVTHSNGADVGVRTISELGKLGFKARALIAIGAAIKSDIEKSGIAKLIDNGSLHHAVAYCSSSDNALKRALIWPYGHLGREGFTDYGRTYGDSAIATRWFPGFDHSTYFDPAHQDATFECAINDIKNPPPAL